MTATINPAADHMVRMDTGANTITLTCIEPGCRWQVRIESSPLSESERVATVRAANDVRNAHAYPDVTVERCDCHPDVTASAGFWSRIRAAR